MAEYREEKSQILNLYNRITRYVAAYVLASRHYSNGEYSKALDDLEQGYTSHEPNMPYLAAGFNGFV